ncbi:MAG: hypothetical protein JRD93_00445 [Deltaproteobacteria bacterium]|nr:hypothetical protein [Deltaproteobacteria bacterium]MBW2660474.1 hypothetical protein [Deltaproteobacteria bacterium]
MENLPGNLEKVVKTLSLPKQSKRFDSWILLAIGDHGKTISIGRLKELLLVLLLTVIIVVVSISYLLIVSGNLSKENDGLRNALDISKKQVTALREERDLFMVRSVLDKSVVEGSLVGIEKKQAGETSDSSIDPKVSVKTSSDSADFDKTVLLISEKQPKEKTDSARSASLPVVSIEDFVILFEPDSSILRVQFKIINTSSDSQPVSGHAFVILKNDDINDSSHLIFPSVTMVSGKPSLYKNGQYFSIYRFKTVRFKAQNDTNPKRFSNASILVYNTEGDLLLEKKYPVKITEVIENILE